MLKGVEMDDDSPLVVPDDDFGPYGALRLTGLQETRPAGNGVFTYDDNSVFAVVTDIQGPEVGKASLVPKAPEVVFPVIRDVVLPPLVRDQPLAPAAIEA